MTTPPDPVPTPGMVRITRVIAAPRALVFSAWTDPAMLARWHAPTGCTITFRHLDIRPGGTFHSCIRSPAGHECWCLGTYQVVRAPERLVYTLAVANAAGELVDPTQVGMDADWPRLTTVTVTFEEEPGDAQRTIMTLRQTVDEALAKRTGAHPSWLVMFDRLAAVLSSGKR